MNKGIYKDNKGRWYIHTSYKGRTITIRGFITKQEANDKYDVAIDKWRKEHGLLDSDTEYESTLNDFFDYRSKRVALETLKKDKMYFKSYWDNVFCHQRLASVFNLDRLKIIYNNVCNDKELTDTKKYRLITAFNEFALFCYMNRYISNDIYTSIKAMYLPVKLNKNIESSKRYISKDERLALLGAIKNKNDYVMFSLLIECGMRISELLGLHFEDFDFNNETLSIKRQLAVNGSMTTQLKTSNSYRKLILSHQTADLTRDYAKHSKICSGRLFRCSHTSFRRKLNEYEKTANIPNYSAHEFRHSVAVDLSKVCLSHNDIVIASNYLGHTISVYENTYCNHYKEKDMKTLLERR